MVESRYESHMLTFMLTLERPSPEQLRHHDRGQRYLYLKQSASQIRSRLVQWIDENGLSEDVMRVGEPTAFNTLFVTSTPRAAEELSRAPGVVGVAPTGEIGVDLLKKAPPEDPDAIDAGPDERGAEDDWLWGEPE